MKYKHSGLVHSIRAISKHGRIDVGRRGTSTQGKAFGDKIKLMEDPGILVFMSIIYLQVERGGSHTNLPRLCGVEEEQVLENIKKDLETEWAKEGNESS